MDMFDLSESQEYEAWLDKAIEDQYRLAISKFRYAVTEEYVKSFASVLEWGVNNEDSNALYLADELGLTGRDLAAIANDRNRFNKEMQEDRVNAYS